MIATPYAVSKNKHCEITFNVCMQLFHGCLRHAWHYCIVTMSTQVLSNMESEKLKTELQYDLAYQITNT